MPRRADRVLLILLGCGAVSGAASPCLAQPVAGGGAVARPGNQRMRAVVVPDRRIDPGMRIKPPKMPAQSTPVIRPPATTPDGSAVVVPK